MLEKIFFCIHEGHENEVKWENVKCYDMKDKGLFDGVKLEKLEKISSLYHTDQFSSIKIWPSHVSQCVSKLSS